MQIRLIGLVFFLVIFGGSIFVLRSSEDPTASPSPADATEAVVPVSAADDKDKEMAIDWIAEILKGGMTSYVLIILSIVACGFTVERFYHLRGKYINPAGYVEFFREEWKKGNTIAISRRAKEFPSVVSELGEFIVNHRHYPYEMMLTSLSDLSGRAMERHNQRTYPLAIIATMSPLIGLNGTIIGMIEAFQKVALFGDTGDASLLADSIGKALITTFLGLMVAIPSLGVYHFLKQKMSLAAMDLEEGMDELISVWRGADGNAETPHNG